MKNTTALVCVLTILITSVFAAGLKWVNHRIDNSQQAVLTQIEAIQTKFTAVSAATNVATPKVQTYTQAPDERIDSISERLGTLEDHFTQLLDQIDELQTTRAREDQFDNLPLPSELENAYATGADSTPSVTHSKPTDNEQAAQKAKKDQQYKTLDIAHTAGIADQWATETNTVVQDTFAEVIQQWPDTDVNINNVDCRETGCRVEMEYTNAAEFNRIQMNMLLKLLPTLPSVRGFQQPGQNGKNKTVLFFSPPKG